MNYNAEAQLKSAKIASRRLSVCPAGTKNRALEAIAETLEKNRSLIVNENIKDVEAAKKAGISSALLDRLALNEKRIEGMITGVREIARLPDPVGETLLETEMQCGARLEKIRVPVGVICMVYEARPNVTVDSAALCLKSGNAVVLRGGSETLNSNRALTALTRKALKESGIPEDAVQFIDTPDRKVIHEIASADKPLIDLIILRGGARMIGDIRRNSNVPVITHGKGLCHTYIDAGADTATAVEIAFNAKVQRPGVCNAMETLLVHEEAAGRVLPPLAEKYRDAGVEIRGCAKTMKILDGIKPAADEDWQEEYLDLVLSIKTVTSIDEAIEHIARYGSGHSEAIITANDANAGKFARETDASAVFINSSTRLHDGGVFGFGAEIGISTGKLHARGTMGLRELTTTKYIIHGTGQIRS